MSGQGSGSSTSTGNGTSGTAGQTLTGSYQPMECESSPRHSLGGRRPGVPASSAPASIDAGTGSLIQSSLGSYNSLILPSIPHLPTAAMMGSPMAGIHHHHHQQPSFYNYAGYGPGPEGHRQVVVPSQVVGAKQRADPDREDSPMVGVCVQQSPVAIH